MQAVSSGQVGLPCWTVWPGPPFVMVSAGVLPQGLQGFMSSASLLGSLSGAVCVVGHLAR